MSTLAYDPKQPIQDWRRDVTFHGLDLNPGIVERIDSFLNAESMDALDVAIAGHWIFTDERFQPQLTNMVQLARQAPGLKGVETFLTDKQLAAMILQIMGLWSEVEPTGIWGNSRFLIKFFSAMGKFIYTTEFERIRSNKV